MLGTAWLALRQANEALRNGRLEEAQRLLGQSAVQGHKKSWEALQQLARAFVDRGERSLRQDDPEAAWTDLLEAEKIGVADCGAEKLRHNLTRLGLAEVKVFLEAGEPRRAAEAIARLRDRSVRQPELKHLEDVAQDWVLAEELAARGEFNRSIQTVQRLRRFMPGQFPALDRFQQELERRHDAFASLLLKLHEAVDQGRWREVVQVSDQVLALAPQHAEARKFRQRAWQTIEPVTVIEAVKAEAAGTRNPPPTPPSRLLLWIDGVGGYLVCLGNRVSLGQATPESAAEVPLLADISRLHARLTRDTEGYLLEASRPVLVNGQGVEKALLQSGDRITLGSSCQLRFVQPVPVSATARLDLTSGHRLPLALDGVVLMADTLVLGPGSQVHIALPDLKQPVVLYRQKDGLGIRCPGSFLVDGQRCQERGNLRSSSSIVGDDFALAVEPVGARLV